jgi:hypothetical protein
MSADLRNMAASSAGVTTITGCEFWALPPPFMVDVIVAVVVF